MGEYYCGKAIDWELFSALSFWASVMNSAKRCNNILNKRGKYHGVYEEI